MFKYLMGLLSLALLSLAQAEDKPAYWELGLGFTGIAFPDYLGSKERNYWLLPFPYFVYRSEHLEVDRDAVTGELFDSPRWELDISLSGSLPVSSDDNDLRRGMPDLDPILEIGPVLKYQLYALSANKGRFLLELPIRAAIASDFTRIEDVGWQSNPRLRYEQERFGTNSNWSLDVTLGPLYGTGRYHDYFYSVDSRFATPNRPAFEADGGFGGWRFAVGFSRRVGDLWYGGFVRYFDLSSTEFADSPLVETHHTVVGGFAIAWILAQSDRRNPR
ncbi:MAG: MipA/OmpV family protein [Candidatus Competibacteraceae bacterium]|nr:MipA/OmpV family protein [Candidatus Competibacteraceae bacterium]